MHLMQQNPIQNGQICLKSQMYKFQIAIKCKNELSSRLHHQAVVTSATRTIFNDYESNENTYENRRLQSYCGPVRNFLANRSFFID